MKIHRKTTQKDGIDHLVRLTELWNRIDSMENPDGLWERMIEKYPEGFIDPKCTDSMKFTYVRSRMIEESSRMPGFSPEETSDIRISYRKERESRLKFYQESHLTSE